MPVLQIAKSAAESGCGLGWILPGANFAVEHGGELYALIVVHWDVNSEDNPRPAIGMLKINQCSISFDN
jgi:hypothetical protein